MVESRELAKVRRTMREVFGIERLRPGQEEVIRSVLDGENTLAIMPTGAGKSLCYQLPALHLPGTTVIISPLISLMKDQVDKLGEAGVEASQVNSALTESERQENLSQIKRKQSEFVFTTPERFTDPAFLDTLGGNKIDFVVIDESHCISEWGHDFRPSYLALGAAIKSLGSPPVLALTATATPEVIEDIRKHLEVGSMRVVNTGIFRPNLRYEVLRVTNETEKRQHLARLLEEIDGNGIIYCATVKTVEALVDFFKGATPAILPYHGKLPSRERKENQERFMAGELKAMVATNAFGMGIDKPDIRFVVHYQMPGSLESYYQESGRAGRDGEAARCILFFQLDDRRTQLFFMGGRYPKLEDVATVYDALPAPNVGRDAEGGKEGGSATVAASVSLAEIQERCAGVAKTKVRVVLSLLKEMKVLRELRGARFRLLKSGLTHAKIESLAKQCEEKGEKDREKLERMMLYGQSAACRWRLLHDYFAETAAQEACGNCDNCLHPVEEQLGLSAATPGTKMHATPGAQAVAAPEQRNGSASSKASKPKGRAKRPPVELAKGDAVKLRKYGEGTVRALEDDKVVVAFPGGETRTFKRDFVRKL